MRACLLKAGKRPGQRTMNMLARSSLTNEPIVVRGDVVIAGNEEYWRYVAKNLRDVPITRSNND